MMSSRSRIRPSLLRSPLLWIGLMVMVFLGWAWRDSVGRWSYVRAGRVGVQSQASGVMLWRVPRDRGLWNWGVHAPSAGGPSGDRFPRFGELLALHLGRPEIWRELSREEWEAFRRTGELDGRRPDAVLGHYYYYNSFGKGGWKAGWGMVFIPYWCFMLAALALWSGLIYWRYRRWSRGLAGPAAEDGGLPEGAGR